MDNLEQFRDMNWIDFSPLLHPEHLISTAKDGQENTQEALGKLTLEGSMAMPDDFTMNDFCQHHEGLSNLLVTPAFPPASVYNVLNDDINQRLSHIQRPLHAASQETETETYGWRPNDNTHASFQSPYSPHINDAISKHTRRVANDIPSCSASQTHNNFDGNHLLLPGTSEQDSTSNICTVDAAPGPRAFNFQCTDLRCRRRSFGRWYDFHRHYNGAHAAEKTVFWCPVDGCDRSESTGDRAFPRKDKMMTHALKIHGIEDVEMEVES